MSTELVEVSKAVAEFDRVSLGLGELQKQYANVVYDVVTTKGMDEAKAARAAIREPRYEVERIRKAAKAPIIALGKRLDSEAARITGELEKLELPIDSAIKNEEARKEREKQAKADAELKRVTDLQEYVVYLRGSPNISSNDDPALIAEHISDLESEVVDASMQEYEQQAREAKASGLSRLRDMHAAAVARVAEQERIKAERAELEALRAAQAKRDAEDRARIAEEEKAAKAAREEELRQQRAEQARIDAELKAKRDAQEAEAAAERKRLADERAAFEREQAEVRRAADEAERVKREQARLASLKKPSDAELIGVLAKHYNAPSAKVVEWILAMDLSNQEQSAA